MAINFNGTTFSAKQTTNNLVNFNGTSMCTVIECEATNQYNVVYDCQWIRNTGRCGFAELIARSGNASFVNYTTYSATPICSCHGDHCIQLTYNGDYREQGFGRCISLYGYVAACNAWYDLMAAHFYNRYNVAYPISFSVTGYCPYRCNACADLCLVKHTYPVQVASAYICLAPSCLLTKGGTNFTFCSCGRTYTSPDLIKGIDSPIVPTDRYGGTVAIPANTWRVSYSGWNGCSPIGWRSIQYDTTCTQRWKFALFIPSINNTTGQFKILEAGVPVATNFCAYIHRTGGTCFNATVSCLIFGFGLGCWTSYYCMLNNGCYYYNQGRCATGSTAPAAWCSCPFNFIQNNMVIDGPFYMRPNCNCNALYTNPLNATCWSCVDWCANYMYMYCTYMFMCNPEHYCSCNCTVATSQPTILWRVQCLGLCRCGAPMCVATNPAENTDVSL